jgi:acetyl esterase/lipase
MNSRYSFLCRNYCCAIALAFIVFSCSKEDASVTTPGTSAAKEITNESYGTNAEQVMDVYLPADRTTTDTKSILLVHGGSWNSGDKSDFNEYIKTIKEKRPGYALFNLNYRLAIDSSTVFPTQENDIRKAVEFISQKRQDYSVSDDFVILGISAGGHLALLQAYKYEAPVKAKAVISFFGPTDLQKLYDSASNSLVRAALTNVVGATPAENPGIYSESSPINFVTSHSPPTLLLQGGQDQLVPRYQAELLQARLVTFGVQNQYVFYPHEGHGWTGDSLDDSFEKILQFLKDYVE